MVVIVCVECLDGRNLEVASFNCNPTLGKTQLLFKTFNLDCCILLYGLSTLHILLSNATQAPTLWDMLLYVTLVHFQKTPPSVFLNARKHFQQSYDFCCEYNYSAPVDRSSFHRDRVSLKKCLLYTPNIQVWRLELLHLLLAWACWGEKLPFCQFVFQWRMFKYPTVMAFSWPTNADIGKPITEVDKSFPNDTIPPLATVVVLVEWLGGTPTFGETPLLLETFDYGFGILCRWGSYIWRR